MAFRRPELEKDNPIASQPYVGPRRRLAQARAMSTKEPVGVSAMKEALQALTDAASRLVKNLPKTRTTARDLNVLQVAIAQAERLL